MLLLHTHITLDCFKTHSKYARDHVTNGVCHNGVLFVRPTVLCCHCVVFGPNTLAT